MKQVSLDHKAIVIGGGFAGLAAAYELAKDGVSVTLFESDSDLGGLAGTFTVGGARLEKFYHYWYTSDRHIVSLVHELGTADRILLRATRTGLYYANSMFRLSSPADVLRFSPLSASDRIRLGMLVLRARAVRNWMELEHLSATEWLKQMGGDRVYKVVWEPLLRGKFGQYAEEVSAVWFWNKLKLRGGSRTASGAEHLAYYRGGFAALADKLAAEIRSRGGEIYTGATVDQLCVDGRWISGVVVGGKFFPANIVVATPALPIIADLVAPHVSSHYVAQLRRIRYLANICVVLELDRSLSDTFWLNVNDPSFPFVGVIEHTNCEPASTYEGSHIVYLSKYLPEADPIYAMSAEALLRYSLPYLKRMFPEFTDTWIRSSYVWRARYAQPIVEHGYSRLIPEYKTPIDGLYIASMAQIYPEDRGTNYAVRDGRHVACLAGRELGDRAASPHSRM